MRRARDGRFVVCVSNFTPVVRHHHHIGVPVGGRYRELLNTDSEIYGGSGVGNLGVTEAVNVRTHGRPASLVLALPPLATLILEPLEAEETI